MKARSLFCLAVLCAASASAFAADVATANTYWKPTNPHAWVVPAATHFAAVDDVAAPPIALEDITEYQTWLTRMSPRAFAVSANSGYGIGYGAKAMQQALDNCEVLSKSKCWLYAVDDQVVYAAQEAQRVSLGRAGLPESRLAAPVVATTVAPAAANAKAVVAPTRPVPGGAS